MRVDNLEVSDELLGTFVPIILYWVYSGFYAIVGSVDKYKLHTRNEENEKNLVPKKDVVLGVLLQQGLQALVAMILFTVTRSDESVQVEAHASLISVARQFFVAMLVMDVWQYAMHRYMHKNPFLYKHIHSQHHRIIVPYAYGAFYNHPLEGLLFDTGGGVLAFLASGMSPRVSIFFFSFATLKAVDDHCGMWLPGNPFKLFFNNNSAYHDVHHQLSGNKYNYSQPFFMIWDRVFGTYMPYQVEQRKEGGLEARFARKME